MARARRRRGAAGRVVFVAALTLAGAGAGASAMLAVSDSALIRGAGGAAGGVAALCSAAWADAAKQRRDTREGAVAQRDRMLNPVVSEPAEDLSVLGLLLATRESAAPFRGRVGDLAWLRAWCDNPAGHPVALVAGAGGVGKTRLAVEFAITRPDPWVAGWLHRGCGGSVLEAVRACGDPALILVDDADTSPDTPPLLENLAAHSGEAPVRVVLITRTAEALAQVAAQVPEQARWTVAPENLPVRTIGPFGSADDHARWFGEAVRAYAAARRSPPPDLPAVTSTGSTARAEEPALTVQAQALLAVLAAERLRPWHHDPHLLPFDQVAGALFEHEQRRWQQVAQQPAWALTDLDPTTQQRAIAALLLSSAATEPEAVTALRSVPDLADASAERLARIARWAFSLYPPAPVRIQPDLLAEWFLITQLTSSSGLAARLDTLTGDDAVILLVLLAHASDHLPAAVPLYARLLQTDPPGLAAAAANAALTARTAQPLLDAALAELVIRTRWTPDSLTEFSRHLPESALPRTRTAVTGAAVDYMRETGTSDDLAVALNRYGISLADLGRDQEAQAAFENALALYRDLAAADSAHQANLANTLTNYGSSLTDLGRHLEALAAREEALALFQDLAAANPSHRPDLARTLVSYGASLTDLGRHPEALAARDKALVLYRDLAAANPAHQPGLASALNNYGVSLTDLGRHREALTADKEALDLHRDLAAANPAQQPSLANALISYGVSLRDLGRHPEALAAKEEALALYRDLAAAHPGHRPSLANALISYGISLRELGRHREALVADEETLALYRDMAAINPAHRPRLAHALTGYGGSLRNLGRDRDAHTATEEALALYRDVAAANPAHRPRLAHTLTNYAVSLWALGRHREAHTALEEALALYRDLAAANPAHQPGLASALTNYGISLRDQGQPTEALAYDREALEIYAVLAQDDPDLYNQTYQHHLSELRRTYDLRGDQSTSVSLHLDPDHKS